MKKFFKFFCIFFVVLALFLSIFAITMSKYSKKVSSDIISNIAEPIIYIETGEYQNIEVLGENKITYNFSVKNYNNKISEVSFKYNLIFEFSQEDAPILINLYKINDNTEEKIELNRKSNVKF